MYRLEYVPRFDRWKVHLVEDLHTETEWGCHVYAPAVDERWRLEEITEQREKHRLFHCVLSTGKRSRDDE